MKEFISRLMDFTDLVQAILVSLLSVSVLFAFLALIVSVALGRFP